MTINQLYGYFNEVNEWNDGILATSYRHFSNIAPLGAWVICLSVDKFKKLLLYGYLTVPLNL